MNRSMTESSTARSVRVDAFVAQMHSTERAAVVRAIEQQDVAELERAAIAARIKQARKEAGLSQPEMADAIGVIERTYQNYESVKSPRTPWSLMNQIATVTGKSTEWLIHGGANTPDVFATPNGQLDRIEAMLAALLRNAGYGVDFIESLGDPPEPTSEDEQDQFPGDDEEDSPDEESG